MPSASILRCALSAPLPLVLLLASTIVVSAQTVINALPYTITTAGEYVLTANLTSPQTTGNLITINASNVTLDLQGHFITGPTNTADTPIGIYAYERANLTVRNGTVSHCTDGILIYGNGNATTNNLNQTIDGLRVSHCSSYGIFLDAAVASTVTNCKVSQFSNTGILIGGFGSVVQGCLVGQTGTTSKTTGIFSNPDGVVRQNTVAGTYYGVFQGLYQDNLVNGCTTPFYGGTDAGGNYSH